MRAFTMMLRGAALGAGLLLAGSACAADIEIQAPWSRATAKGAAVGGGYLTIVNKGNGGGPAGVRHGRCRGKGRNPRNGDG